MTSIVLRAAAFAARALPPGMSRAFYRLGPLTRWIRLLLNRAAPQGIAPVVIAGGDLAGVQLLLDLQVDKDLWLGTYEPEVTRAVRLLVHPGMTAYDLGANIGYVTMLLAKAVGETGRVVAVEPLPANLDRLRAAVELNRMEHRIRVVPKAVGAAGGPARFLVHRSPGMGRLEAGSGRGPGFESAIDTEVVSLDDLVHEQDFPRPDVIKIDLEGGEVDALQGMRRILLEARPVLLIETHGQAEARGVWDLLTAAGYSLRDLDHDSRVVAAAGDMPPKGHLLAAAQGGRE
ncbi:MAG TPA: FkbM family methyltransferase [Anaerolineales bacterium]|nr:FkbM family methyltransferase [Anaerolineales bacterium]